MNQHGKSWLRRLPGLDADDELTVTLAQIAYGGLVLLLLLIIVSRCVPDPGPPSDAPILPLVESAPLWGYLQLLLA